MIIKRVETVEYAATASTMERVTTIKWYIFNLCVASSRITTQVLEY